MNILVTGCCGFIGSNLIKKLLKDGYSVIGIDNFLLGSYKNISNISSNNFKFFEINIAEEESISHLERYLNDEHEINEIWHLAANSDIQRGNQDSNIDLKNTFLSTYYLLEFAKRNNVKKFHFASSSAVYGDHGEKKLDELSSPLLPISNYGSMKLASEAIISAATEQFLDFSFIYRFPNVVGLPMTHGILFDFFKKIENDNTILEVLGDGTQQKLYLHVDDLIDAMVTIKKHSRSKYNIINIGPDDDGISVKSIAELFKKLTNGNFIINYGKNNFGWPGDVPKFNYDISKIKNFGWIPKLGSLQAIKKTISDSIG